MFLKSKAVQIFKKKPNLSNICPGCGGAQVFKWENVGGGRNVILTSSTHEECYKKYWESIKEFDYEVTVKPNPLQEVA